MESGVTLNSISVTSQTQKKQKLKTFISRDITNEKINQFNEMLSTINWENVLNELNPQSILDNFYEEFISAFNLHFPVREVRFNKTESVRMYINLVKK